ncbi:MAG: tripartite tricarboxylate transporter permease [Planctomycetes bacterium]|nr:tripartite tricarboxylate transporter permease [Planctomycetota bacterium]MCH9726086.1 tripartite tricarboxylate transporter permease [Planctomycetota bacterium]MCH9777238.1 tripartite tricarboxylate transporter permease [Planctomycetota bacterium]MCH9790546.1 tripartite tricarboxylate transporter permease [Planctomycetota bacterium]MDF1744461.1 tripartite tricarboxylate transporter permease [Gimesia sp.]
MESTFITAVQNIASPEVLLVIFLAAVYGLFVGSIPGLTATMAVALLIPLTFYLDNLSAIAAIVTLEACSIFAGDIPTTLVRIPGTPSSAAYTDDAYSLTQKGLHETSLGVSLVFSVAGGLFGALVLILAAPLLAKIAFQFTTYEYFWLYVLGLSCAAIVSTGSRLKGALALMIGLMFSTVGLSEVHSVPRFTFGFDELFTGINFIPAMIGLFGLSEVFRNCLTSKTDEKVQQLQSTLNSEDDRSVWKHLKPVFGGVLPQFWKRKFSWLRSSCIGSTIGMIPGAGADIAAWISYAVSKKLSKTPEEYGKGSLDAVGDATSANNSALAGAWIPALVLGIPGDSVTAIVIGVLLMKNITPGPEIFNNPDQLVLVHGIYLTFILVNLLLIPLGFLAIRSGSQLVRVPRRILMPLILMFCVVGSYSINGSYFDVWVMLGMGLIGFTLEVFEIPLGPVVLGIILGGRLEQAFVQNLTKDDSFFSFFNRPISAGLGIFCLALWLIPLVMPFLRKKWQIEN